MEPNVFVQIVRSDSLVEVVIQQITQAIVSGKLQPGNKLVETRLSEQLGVSRAPLREAFRRLEQTGLIEKIPHRGTFVARLTKEDVVELHLVRELLEGLAARLLAEQGNQAAIAELSAILQAMRQAAIADDRPRIIALDADFHDALVTLTGQKLLREVWQVVGMRLRRFILLKRKRLYLTLDQAAVLHEPIVRAIAAGDAEAAEREARFHVADAARELDF